MATAKKTDALKQKPIERVSEQKVEPAPKTVQKKTVEQLIMVDSVANILKRIQGYWNEQYIIVSTTNVGNNQVMVVLERGIE